MHPITKLLTSAFLILALLSGGKVEMVVEEMDIKQARLFSLLDLGKFMQD